MKRFACCLMLLTALLFCAAFASASAHDPIILTEEEAAAANLFLSNFTEVGMKSCECYYDDMNLVDFAHDHLWFNSHDSYEYGEYFGGNNCRVSDERIQSIIDDYFYDSYEVDLTQTRALKGKPSRLRSLCRLSFFKQALTKIRFQHCC